MKPNTLFYFLSILIVGLSAGCGDSGIGGGQVCTAVGCDDGITVQVSDDRPDSLSLTIYLNDDPVAFDSINCTEQDDSCFLRAGGVTPVTVTVEIEWNNGEFRQTLTPEYESFQPNGPNCPPVCDIAAIEIDLTGMEE